MKQSILAVLTLATFIISAKAQGIPQEITNLQTEITELKAVVVALRQQVVTINSSSVMALVPFVTVDPNPELGVIGPNIVFHGANIHVESGSGATDDNGNITGLGNLIIGYNEAVSTPGTYTYYPSVNYRYGSHNLIVGRYNTWGSTSLPAFGGFVAGERNSIFGEAQSILGGTSNSIQVASTEGSSQSVIVGGAENQIIGTSCVVVGGQENAVYGSNSVVLGGYACEGNGEEAVILGGFGLDIAGASNFSVQSYGQPSISTYQRNGVIVPFTAPGFPAPTPTP
jgi:hypothetical protein